MNLIVFLIRLLAGLIFLATAGMSLDPTLPDTNPEWHANAPASIASIFMLVLTYWPLIAEAKHRRLVPRLPTLRSFTVRRFIIFGRWYMAYCMGIISVAYFYELHFGFGVLSLIATAAMMPPLDMLFFAPRKQMAERLKDDPTLLKLLANLSAACTVLSFGFYANKNYPVTIDMLLTSIGLLLIVAAILLAKGSRKAFSIKFAEPAASGFPRIQPILAQEIVEVKQEVVEAKQEPPAEPGANRWAKPGNRPDAKPEAKPEVQPEVEAKPEAKGTAKPPAKFKYYSANALYWEWPIPKEAQRQLLDEQSFNLLIKGFEKTWLESKEYQQRLTLHRNPTIVIQEIIAHTEDYIKLIRLREDLLIGGIRTGPKRDPSKSVLDEIDKIWLADKRLRSLYRAAERFHEKRTPEQFISSLRAMAPHIAEYRAMINVVKHLKHALSRLPSEAPVTKARGVSRVTKTQQPVQSSTPQQPAPAISSEQRYFEIIDYLIQLGKNFEHYPDLSKKEFDEQWYRDYFLPGLNTRDPEYSAKGEVFNRRGKTDILVFDRKGNNLLIAECKLWKGEAYLREGVDQLLHRYVNWRDEKTAIVIFNRDVKNFTAVIETAVKTISGHPLCQKGHQRTDCSWSYQFHHPNDAAKTIRLELILFNFV